MPDQHAANNSAADGNATPRRRKRDIETAAEKPRPLPVHVDGIPVELRSLDRWVGWDWTWDKKKSKWDKPPLNANTGRGASSTDPKTWASLPVAVAAMQERGWDGIGFVLHAGAGFVGVDIDDARDPDTGELEAWAAEIVRDLDSYAEVSPSGTGIKLWLRGNLPEGCGHKSKVALGGVEVYCRGRYFTVTGQRASGAPATVNDRQAQLDALLARLGLTGKRHPAPATAMPKSEPTQIPPTPAPEANGQAGNVCGRAGGSNLSDEALLAKAMTAANGDKFTALFRGDTDAYKGDQSKGDLALCGHLAFWCGPDPSRIDRLFRQSMLMRATWDERHDGDGRTYGEMTIAKALRDRTTFFGDGLKSAPQVGVSDATAVDPPEEIHLTDTGNAYRFARAHREHARYCEHWGCWLTWTGTHWEEDRTGATVRLAKTVVRELLADAREKLQCIAKRLQELADRADDEDLDAIKADLQQQQKTAQKQIAWALKSESRPRIDAMLSLARCELPIVPDQMERDPWLFNCQNGTLDLRTGELRPHQREDLLTKVAPVTFDPQATCPTFMKFMGDAFPERSDAAEERGDQELIAFIPRLFGSCLSGIVIDQILAVLYGGGANGKTTMLETVCSILGPYAGPAPEGLLLIRRGERHPVELADLFGKRLVHSAETGEGAGLDETRVKRLTGNDTIKGRRMCENFWTFAPTHKLFICTNNKPRITGTDHAIRRRIILVPFTSTFWDPDRPLAPGQERPARFRQDKRLKEKLFAERSGILNLLVHGCLEWQRDGLRPPPTVLEATEEYLNDVGVIRQFIEERCQRHADSAVRVAAWAYTGWPSAYADCAVSNWDRGSQPRLIQARRPLGPSTCQSVRPPSLFGRGTLPAACSRHHVASETPARRAALAALTCSGSTAGLASGDWPPRV